MSDPAADKPCTDPGWVQGESPNIAAALLWFNRKSIAQDDTTFRMCQLATAIIGAFFSMVFIGSANPQTKLIVLSSKRFDGPAYPTPQVRSHPAVVYVFVMVSDVE